MREKGVENHFDILVNNLLGVINSKFLSVYGQIGWLKQLVILIKMWGKHSDRNFINEHMFSSYSLNLLLFHFLIEKNKIQLIMDARERNQNAPHFMYRRQINDDEEQEFKVYFTFKTDPENVTNLTKVSLYDLLTEFFSYFMEGGEHWRKSLQNQIITVDGSKDKVFDKEYIFTIKDPFDVKYNPGRVKIGKKDIVVEAFKIAYKCLKTRNPELIESLFC